MTDILDKSGCNKKLKMGLMEIECCLDGKHDWHEGNILNYAYTGSVTKIDWHNDDRRQFVGEFVTCSESSCILPDDHRGDHVI